MQNSLKKIRNFFVAVGHWWQKYLQSIVESFHNFFHEIFPFFFLLPHEQTIGNTAEEIYFALLYARRRNKKLILLHRWSFWGHPAICNTEIFYVQSPYILGGITGRLFQFGGNTFATILWGQVPAACTYLSFNIPYLFLYILGKTKGKERVHYKHCFYDLTIGEKLIWFNGAAEEDQPVNWNAEIAQPITISLRPGMQELGERILKKWGIEPGSAFVCVHIRDGGFWSDHEDARNCHYENYLKTFTALVERGYWVIRLGDSKMRKLPSMNQVIDYAHTAQKSEAMDLFLLKNCSLYIGQNSGILDVAKMFGRKIVAVNITEWTFGPPMARNDLVLLKHFYSKSKRRFLSIQELLQFPYSWQYFSPTTAREDLLVVENTADEILAVTLEALSQDANYQYSTLQERFISSREAQVRSWLQEKELLPGRENTKAFLSRVKSRESGPQSTLGRKFLEENWAENKKIF